MSIDIDGLDISGCTIDGVDVSEITIGGVSVWNAFKWLYTGDYNNYVKQLSVLDGSENWGHNPASNPVYALALSIDKSKIYSVDGNKVYEHTTEPYPIAGWTFTSTNGTIKSLAVSEDGNYVYCGSGSTTIDQINTSDGSSGWTDIKYYAGTVTELVVSGDMLYSARVSTIDIQPVIPDGSYSSVPNTTGTVVSFIVSSDRSRLYRGDAYGYVSEIILNSLGKWGSNGWKVRVSAIASISISEDGNYIYCGTGSRHLVQIDTSDGSIGWEYTGDYTAIVYGSTISPSGEHIYGCGKEVVKQNTSDSTVEWKSPSGTDILTIVS